jgi:hypothetical protein
MPIPMIITRRTSGSRYFQSYIRLGVSNTLGGLHLEFAFLRPSVGKTLGGCASNWHFFAPALVTCSGAPSYNPMLATLGGYAYMLTSTVFNDINCTPSATSTLVRGIWHLPTRRRWLYVVSTPVRGIRLLSSTRHRYEPLRLQRPNARGLDNDIAPND